MGTDSHRTIPKNSSGCRLLIGHKKCVVLLAWGTTDLCLRVLDERKATKVGSTATVSGTVYWTYPILPFGIVACTFFPTTFLEIAVCPHLPGSFTKLVRARETFIFYFPNQKRRNYRWVEKTFGMLSAGAIQFAPRIFCFWRITMYRK